MRTQIPVSTGPVIANRLAACIEAEADKAQSTRNQITAMRLAAHHVRALAEAAEKAGLRMQINWWR
jgi:hypothetical protein